MRIREEGDLWVQRTCVRCYGRLEVTRDTDDDGCIRGDVKATAKQIVSDVGWKKMRAKIRAGRNRLLSLLGKRSRP